VGKINAVTINAISCFKQALPLLFKAKKAGAQSKEVQTMCDGDGCNGHGNFALPACPHST